MIYNSIFNDPNNRRRITYSHVWWDNAFSDTELDEINNICSSYNLVKGVTVGESDARKSSIFFVSKDVKTGWIFDKFNTVIKSINDQFYGFDLNGYETFQYTLYDSNEKYDWHMDTIFGNNLSENMMNGDTRKLTLVMLLNSPGKDFTGGEFQLNEGNQNAPTTPEYFRGRILVFPSFFCHKVTPILSGVRKSIVIWVEGPKFR